MRCKSAHIEDPIFVSVALIILSRWLIESDQIRLFWENLRHKFKALLNTMTRYTHSFLKYVFDTLRIVVCREEVMCWWCKQVPHKVVELPQSLFSLLFPVCLPQTLLSAYLTHCLLHFRHLHLSLVIFALPLRLLLQDVLIQMLKLVPTQSPVQASLKSWGNNPIRSR